MYTKNMAMTDVWSWLKQEQGVYKSNQTNFQTISRRHFNKTL